MHWKKYFYLLIPFIVLGIILFIFLPQQYRVIAQVVPFIFWIVYYTWIHIDKKRNNDNRSSEKIEDNIF